MKLGTDTIGKAYLGTDEISRLCLGTDLVFDAFQAAWTPAAMFENSEGGAWYDVSDLSTVFSDVDGLIPAEVDGDVRRINDKSGNGYHMTSVNANTLRKSGDKYYVEIANTMQSEQLPLTLPCFQAWAFSHDVASNNTILGLVSGITGFLLVSISGPRPYWRSAFTGQASINANIPTGLVDIDTNYAISAIHIPDMIADARVDGVEVVALDGGWPVDAELGDVRVTIAANVKFYGSVILFALPKRQRALAETWAGNLIGKEIDAKPDVLSYCNGIATSDKMMVAATTTFVTDNVKVRVSENSDLSSPVYVSPDPVSSYRKNTKLPISGLSANTPYHYGIEVDGKMSPLRGSFKTIPTGAASFEFASSSCAVTGSNIIAFENVLNDSGNLFFVHLGDFHYGDINNFGDWHRQLAYDQVFAAERQHALYRGMSFAYIYDDHDFAGNDSDKDNSGAERAVISFRNRFPYEWVESGSTDAAYQSWVIGRVRFILTDERSQRDDWKVAESESKTMLGPTQKSWFKSELLDAENAGQAIVWLSTVPFNQDTANDTWGGFKTEQKELADFFHDNGLTNRILVISGDRHTLATWETPTGYGTGGVGAVKEISASPMERPEVVPSIYAKHFVVDTGGPTLQITSQGIYADKVTGDETIEETLVVTLDC